MTLPNLTTLKRARTGRTSSWDQSGRNADFWLIQPGETRLLADLQGPGCITHIWMTQPSHYRECLLRFTWDNAAHPSVLVPLGISSAWAITWSTHSSLSCSAPPLSGITSLTRARR